MVVGFRHIAKSLVLQPEVSDEASSTCKREVFPSTAGLKQMSRPSQIMSYSIKCNLALTLTH
jgi:hypothetical protein